VTEAKEPPEQSATSKAEAMALLEEAEAEAAEAEALAAAARARARAARLRRAALAEAEAEAERTKAEAAEPTQAAEAAEPTEAAEAAVPTQAAEAADETAQVEETVEVSDDKPADKPTKAAKTRSRRPRRRRRLPSLSTTLKVAAVILIVAFAGGSAYMLWQDHDTNERAQRAASFVAGAKQGVVNMTTMDFNRAKEDVQRVLDTTTGQFRDDFQQRAKDFTSVVEQSKVVTQGTITTAALESMDDHSASVLVLATSRITNAAGAKDEPRLWRLRVTVTEEDGQYKMSKLEFVM
jgi:Mce-associated membrane protein